MMTRDPVTLAEPAITEPAVAERPPLPDDGDEDMSVAVNPAGAAGHAVAALASERRIGELLVASGCMTEAQVEQILAEQRLKRRPFGEIAIANGMTTRSRVVWALSQQFNYAYADAETREGIRRELVMAHSPFSDEVECFRSLRTELAMGVLSGAEGPKPALAVVSANVGDGKSFIISNLAIAFGQARARTLIVDADLRSPRVHRLFGVSGALGLSNLLSGRPQRKVLQKVKFLPNLYVMAAGPVPPNPTELIHQPTFDLMLQELASKFDAVLVDTPAAVHGSDAELIASRAGAALVIARRDATEAAGVSALLQRLRKRSVAVAGVMMNVV